MTNNLYDLDNTTLFWRTPTPEEVDAGTHADISDLASDRYITEAELNDVHNLLSLDAWNGSTNATIILDESVLYEMESGLIIAQRVEYAVEGDTYLTQQAAIDAARSLSLAGGRSIAIRTQWEVYLTVDLTHIHHAA